MALARTLAVLLLVAIALSSCSSGPRNLTPFEAECWNIRAIGDQIGTLADVAKTNPAAARRVRTLERLLAKKAEVARKDLEENGPFNSGDDCLQQGAQLDALAWGLTSSPVARGHAKVWYQMLLDFYPDSPLADEARTYIAHPSPIQTP